MTKDEITAWLTRHSYVKRQGVWSKKVKSVGEGQVVEHSFIIRPKTLFKRMETNVKAPTEGKRWLRTWSAFFSQLSVDGNDHLVGMTPRRFERTGSSRDEKVALAD